MNNYQGNQITKEELIALREFVQRYIDIKDYGIHVWGRFFYERVYSMVAKLDGAIQQDRDLELNQEWFSYIEIRHLANMVESEPLHRRIDELYEHWWIDSPAGNFLSLRLKLKRRPGKKVLYCH